MAFFDQVYQKLFPAKDQAQKSLVHEVINRSETYVKEYNLWKHSIPRKDLVEAIGKSYRLKESGHIGEPDVHLLETQYSNGFAISFNDSLSKKDFKFLFDWFAEKTEALGYARATSDLLISNKKTYVESKEKHYLKPKSDDETPINQRFGNILIEHILIDDRPSYVKVVANVYSDRMYQKPEHFSDLAEYLLDLN